MSKDKNTSNVAWIWIASLAVLPFLWAASTWVIDNTSLANIWTAATNLANWLAQSFFKVLPYIVPVVIVLIIVGFVISVIKRR